MISVSSKWSGGRGGRALQSILVYPGDIGLQLLCKAIMLHCSAPQGDYTTAASRPIVHQEWRVVRDTQTTDSLQTRNTQTRLLTFSLMMELVVVVAPEMANESDIRDYRRRSV